MDFTNYSRKDLENTTILELRLLARNMKVKSPTSKSKSQLVDAIMEFLAKQNVQLTGESKVEYRKKPGRPPKDSLVFNDSVQLVTASELADIKEIKIMEGITTDLDTAFAVNTNDPAVKLVRSPEYKKMKYEKAQLAKKEKLPEPPIEIEDPARSVEQEERPSPALEAPTQTRPVNEYVNPKNNRNNNSYNNQNRNNYNRNQNNKNYSNNNQTVNSGATANDNACDESALDVNALEIKEGVLEIMADGYGFLRAQNYECGDNDAYLANQKIKKCGLRKGDWIKAEARKTCENRPAGIVNILEVNGRKPETAFNRRMFDTLTPIYPDERFKLEVPKENNDFAIRCIDMVAPIGKGQRAMIVSPPKAGKTTLLKKVANSIATNYPNAHLMVLLIDERPEEVTDMKRSIKGEVVFSTFDEMPEHHTKAAELVLERAKRLVELGEDVIILMDSLTRLARAYNLTIAPTGRTLSGGIDPGALHSPKRFFGAARNIEYGGSLTIIATALVDTGSRMDDVIYEEFKGTGNMEIHLDRKLSEKRIFPAIDLNRSGTRREELLLDQFEVQGIWAMRKMLSVGDTADATENLLNMLVKTKTNNEFLQQLNLQLMALQKNGFNIK